MRGSVAAFPARTTARALIGVLLWAAVAGADAPFPPARPDEWRLPNADLYAVASREGWIWAAGYWGTVLRSRDAGATWEHVTTPTHDTLFDIDFADARRGWAVGAGGLVLRTTDGGASWTRQPVEVPDELGGVRPLDTHLLSVSAVSADEAWAAGDFGVLLHMRDGQRWEPVALAEDLFDDEEPPDRILNGVHFTDASHGWVVGEFGTTLRTSDGGATWTARRELVDTPPDLYLFAVRGLDGERAAAVGLAGTLLVTRDAGATWEPWRTGSSAPLFAVEWTARSATVAGDRGELLTSADGGSSWRESERPRLFNWLAALTRSADGRLFAVGEKGVVLRSDDGGARWTQLRGQAPLPLSGVSVPDPGASQTIPLTTGGEAP